MDPELTQEHRPGPETAPEPAAEVVTKAEIILDNLAEQLRLVLEEQRHIGDIADIVRDLGCFNAALIVIRDDQRTVLERLDTVAKAIRRLDANQAAVVDALRAILSHTRADDRIASLENKFQTWLSTGGKPTP